VRRTLVFCAVGLGIASVPACSSGRTTHAPAVQVSPVAGTPTTRFVVSFRGPDKTGAADGQVRRYDVTATGPQGEQGCQGGTTTVPAPTRAHAHVRATLKPGPRGWCVGAYHGSVVETMRPQCDPHLACPQYIVLVRNVGHFNFRVRAASH
jgi:hypothetical protein